jgi:hypothetical protein
VPQKRQTPLSHLIPASPPAASASCTPGTVTPAATAVAATALVLIKSRRVNFIVSPPRKKHRLSKIDQAAASASILPMVTAATGHGPKHAPQPVQAMGLTSGRATAPTEILKRIAPTGHDSPQVRHITCFSVRQDEATMAINDHGFPSVRLFKASLLHFSAQSPQNVHSPLEKLTWGKPPRPVSRIFSGQTPIQSPHRLHASTKYGSVIAQGGRITCLDPLKFPRIN